MNPTNKPTTYTSLPFTTTPQLATVYALSAATLNPWNHYVNENTDRKEEITSQNSQVMVLFYLHI
jgi:hypothetical protein